MDTEVEAMTGIEPMIYVNSNYATYELESWLDKYDLWIAHWTCTSASTPGTGIWNGDWAFWQYYGPSYCGDNYVPGISENVDLDVFNGTIAEFMLLLSGEEHRFLVWFPQKMVLIKRVALLFNGILFLMLLTMNFL